MGRIAGYFSKGNMGVDTTPIFREMENRGKYDALIYTRDEVISFSSGSQLPELTDDDSMISLFDPSMALSTTHLPGSGAGITAVCDVDLYKWDELYDTQGSIFSVNINNDADFMQLFLSDIFKSTNSEGSGISQTLAFLDSSLRKLRGVYAFACKANDRIYLARDLIGVKPLWYDVSEGLAFASEKKFLEKAGYTEVKELSPRHILCYDLKDDTFTMHEREFLSKLPEVEGSEDDVRDELLSLLRDAVSVRVPDEDFGVMFSAGIDSTILASICNEIAKEKGVSVTCYTVGLSGEVSSPDIICAKRISEELGFDLKVHEIDLEAVEEYLKVQGRFKHLFLPENRHLIDEIQAEVDKNWEELKRKCGK